MVKKIIGFFLLMGTQWPAWAQCAMCRATVENNISESSTSLGASLNAGILYLFIMPYLLAAVIGILWFRASRKNALKNKIRIHPVR